MEKHYCLFCDDKTEGHTYTRVTRTQKKFKLFRCSVCKKSSPTKDYKEE